MIPQLIKLMMAAKGSKGGVDHLEQGKQVGEAVDPNELNQQATGVPSALLKYAQKNGQMNQQATGIPSQLLKLLGNR